MSDYEDGEPGFEPSYIGSEFFLLGKIVGGSHHLPLRSLGFICRTNSNTVRLGLRLGLRTGSEDLGQGTTTPYCKGVGLGSLGNV